MSRRERAMRDRVQALYLKQNDAYRLIEKERERVKVAKKMYQRATVFYEIACEELLKEFP